METCSYTWNELDEENEIIKKTCQEKIWRGSKKHCIFHDPSKKKDIELFAQKIQEKLNKKDYNFRGFLFPKNIDFSNEKFEKDACFDETTFHDVSFRRAVFQYVSFVEATFQNASFFRTIFRDVSFLGAIFERNLDFTPKQVNELNLQNTKFLFKGHITADLSRTKFNRADLENVAFVGCEWPENLYEEINMEEEGLNFKELETIYRNLKQNMQRHGNYSKAGDFYYREMEMKRKQSRVFTLEWLGQNTLRILCGYGEKPIRVITISLLIIFLGAILFFFCGVARVGTELPPQRNPYIIDYSLDSLSFDQTVLLDFGYCIYYSVVTFTTLGYGDIHPLGHSHIFASIEAFTGAFFIALFVLVFGRKMMR